MCRSTTDEPEIEVGDEIELCVELADRPADCRETGIAANWVILVAVDDAFQLVATEAETTTAPEPELDEIVRSFCDECALVFDRCFVEATTLAVDRLAQDAVNLLKSADPTRR